MACKEETKPILHKEENIVKYDFKYAKGFSISEHLN
jgi:hypothetical protein